MRYIKRAFSEFIDDDCPMMAAAIAYYTVLSLPALLVIILTIAGYAISEQEAERAIQQQAGSYIGGGSSGAIATMMRTASERGSAGALGTIISALVLLIGATTAFAQLQTALNRAWEVAPDEQHQGVWGMLRKRLLSFALIIAIAFLLLVSVAFSTTLSAAGGVAEAIFGEASGWALWLLSTAGSFVVLTLLFGVIYKVLPDAELHWRDVLAGAAMTSALFVLGNTLLGLYLGRTDPGSGYGAAGSVVLILLWVYYASMIVLFGAEVTQVYMNARGRQIQPRPGAVRTEAYHRRQREQRPSA
ncbi:MAG: YihY/virulence factor BrkB family protein [bacterium]|jgi:membrane protein